MRAPLTGRRRRRADLIHTARRQQHAAAPPHKPADPGRDQLLREFDERLDERLDAETTKGNLAILLAGFAVLMAAVAAVTIFLVAADSETSSSEAVASDAGAATAAVGADEAVDISAEAGEGIDFHPYERPDPTLPAVPAGEVKRFKIDVYEHVTKVSDDLAPTRVWSYGVNGELNRGTGVSQPIVVNQGDEVEIELVNGGSEAMDVQMPHSIDFHSSKVAPNEAFATIGPGETHSFGFTAEHPGVFLYHCATPPVLHHTAAGMVGMMVVKPKGMQPVDRELWLTQQEFYIGEPGEDASYTKAQAKEPDVIAFNGYADQYLDHPIEVKAGETIRMFVLNGGPNIWSAFHVIGTVFDRTYSEGVEGKSAQTVDLNPNQGGWVEFTLDEEGVYPFVTHAFADMERGAVGALATEGAVVEGAGAEH